MKKIVFMVMVFCVVGMVGCRKDDGGENGGNGGNGEVVKHNVELVYGYDFNSQDWQHIELDTIRKYNNDKNVDTIFMVPEQSDQFVILSSTPFQNIIVPELRERKNVNPEKVWGKGTLVINPMVVENNPEIVRFFRDTMGYQVALPVKY